MAALNYIPFHDALTQGDKRGLSRATRFIYLELTLHAKPYGGRLPLPRGFKTDIDAIEDILGGSRREISSAIATLVVPLDPTDPEDRPLITIEGPPGRRVLSIVAYPEWSPNALSTPRVRKYRDKQREQSRGDVSSGNAFPGVSETPTRNTKPRVSETAQSKGKEREEKETPVVPKGPSEPEREASDPADPDRGVPSSEWAMHDRLFISAYETAVRAALGNPRWTMRRTSDLQRVLATCCLGAERGDIPGWIAARVRELVAFIATVPDADRRFWPEPDAGAMLRWFNRKSPKAETTATTGAPKRQPTPPYLREYVDPYEAAEVPAGRGAGAGR